MNAVAREIPPVPVEPAREVVLTLSVVEAQMLINTFGNWHTYLAQKFRAEGASYVDKEFLATQAMSIGNSLYSALDAAGFRVQYRPAK